MKPTSYMLHFSPFKAPVRLAKYVYIYLTQTQSWQNLPHSIFNFNFNYKWTRIMHGSTPLWPLVYPICTLFANWDIQWLGYPYFLHFFLHSVMQRGTYSPISCTLFLLHPWMEFKETFYWESSFQLYAYIRFWWN